MEGLWYDAPVVDFHSMMHRSTNPIPTCRLLSSTCTALMVAFMLAACGAEKPGPVEPDSYVARLDAEARRPDCKPGPRPRWQIFDLGGNDAVGFSQRAASVCRLELEIPVDATLSLSAHTVSGNPSHPSPAPLTIAILDPDGERVVFADTLRPGGTLTLDGLDLGTEHGPGSSIELRHLGNRRAPPIEWSGLVLRARIPGKKPPRGWTRPYEAAVAEFAAQLTSPPKTGLPKRRLLVVGIDGASGSLLDELMEAGDVPNLAALAKRGRRGRLQSTFIPESAMAWTSLRTGVTSGFHGVYHFLSPDRARSSYWSWLDAAGLRSIVIGVPKSSPEEPFDGILVGGWDLNSTEPYTRPRELAKYLTTAGYEPAIANVPDAARFATRMRKRSDLAIALLGQLDWDHAFVVYEYSDTAGHRFGLRTEGWRQTYRSLDHEFGRLLATVGPDTSVLVVSDHGWKRFSRAFSPAAWLRANGFETWAPHIYGGHRVALRPTSPQTPEDEARSIAELRTALSLLRDPETGGKVVSRVLRLAEGIPGPFSERSSLRLLIELEPTYHAAGKAKGDVIWPPGRAEHHDVEGLYLFAGPGIDPGTGRDASVLDIAPTIAAYFGVAPPADLTGQPLVEIVPARLLTTTPAVGVRDVEDREIPPVSPPSPALKENLRALGYIDEED